MKKTMNFFCRTLLLVLAFVTGASGGVMMADASNLPDAGKTEAGADATGGTEGIATETLGRDEGDDNFYMDEVDTRIVKIRPMTTPVDQISRHAKARPSSSFVVKFYSVGTRAIKCTTSAAMTAMTTGASTTLKVSDPNMFTQDDTIRVVGVRAITDSSGNAYTSSDSNVPDLILCVCGKDSSTNMPTVYAVNGTKDSSGNAILLPAIPAGTILIRMGKACGELDVQTGRFNNIPAPEQQYCQNFMVQVEQSFFDRMAKKEVKWSFTDIEEDAIYDMRLAVENTFLFGAKNVIKHISKDGMNTWFTGGIWYMAGKDIEIGGWNETSKRIEITDDNLVDITKDLFTGPGCGNKQKILLCGSDVLATLSKIKSEKFRLKESVEQWNLKFRSWETDFGEIHTIHHELFDLNGMSDCAFALDTAYLTKSTHISWSRNILDLKSAGIRNTEAITLQEVSCLYLRCPNAHARIRLAQKPAEDTTDTSSDTSSDTSNA